MKLGFAPSTMSGALQRAHKHLGFSSLGQLLRAYCASRETIDFDENEARGAKEMTIDRAHTVGINATVRQEAVMKVAAFAGLIGGCGMVVVARRRRHQDPRPISSGPRPALKP
jgi:hypothetical protein